MIFFIDLHPFSFE